MMSPISNKKVLMYGYPTNITIKDPLKFMTFRPKKFRLTSTDVGAPYHSTLFFGYLAVFGATIFFQINEIKKQKVWKEKRLHNVENYWKRAKANFKRMNGTKDGFVESYLNEFMWREQFGPTLDLAYENLLEQINEKQPC
uniref:Uncharacterized protein n=1 Tax=Romanomermis culicivorax TaxID=13658 RepID=A0A915KHY2_ROMCU